MSQVDGIRTAKIIEYIFVVVILLFVFFSSTFAVYLLFAIYALGKMIFVMSYWRRKCNMEQTKKIFTN